MTDPTRSYTRKRHGKWPWNYATNCGELNKFWAKGIERNKGYESMITLGMPGDGDLPKSESANISLLEKIAADQRSIIASHENKDVRVGPQDWRSIER